MEKERQLDNLQLWEFSRADGSLGGADCGLNREGGSGRMGQYGPRVFKEEATLPARRMGPISISASVHM